MRALLIHISDIHLKETGNSILEKKEQLFNAFQNELLNVENLFMVISGDVAFSGKESEYQQAIELFNNIKSKVERYSQKEIEWVIVPGNHDCDFDNGSKTVRKILIEQIQQDRNVINDEIIEQCCKNQGNFLKFLKSYQSNGNILYEGKLLRILEYKFDKFNIIFNCYNTSWMSQRHEEPGKMYFPIQYYPKKYINHKANLVISLLHHSFNWHEPVNSRELRQHLEETSDIVLTGHEHVASKSKKDDFEGNYTEFIEGAVLQESNDDEESGFNLVLVDLESESQKILQYKWDGKIYSLVSKNNEWFSYKRSKQISKTVFKINSQFRQILNDIGASFTHPNKSELVLEDFFVYPALRELRIDKRSEEEQPVLDNIVNSTLLFEINDTENKVLLVGDDKSGKSSLCRMLYKHYYNNGYVPVSIEGNPINSTSIERFDRLVTRYYTEQYSNDTLEIFRQLDNQRKLLIIDDFDKSKLNTQYKPVLLNRINKCYPNIIITANNLFQIEEILYKEKSEEETEDILEHYKQFEILEFGHRLRSQLINTWNKLGKEEWITKYELIHKNDNVEKIVNIIIGKNLVPSYPIFLLTILQTIEAGTSHDLKESIYSHYYEYLITQALLKTDISKDELNAYYNYITVLSYHFFEKELYEISQNHLHSFHQWYCKKYSLSSILNFDKVIDRLLKAFILQENKNTYKFRYKYIYYFFVAKYFSNNIQQEEIKQKISEMCKRLYKEEFANIIMFSIHHSQDPFILEEILENAKTYFSEFEIIKFEKDVSTINTLLDEIPKLVLHQIDVKENRERKLQIQDEIELSEKQNSNDHFTDLEQQEEDNDELDIILKLNVAFKTIEILGQVLKNYYGSLEGKTKLILGEEAYFVSKR